MRARNNVVGAEVAPVSESTNNSSGSDENKPLKNKPKNTRLRQQKLPAWQPILTAFTAIPTIFLIGIIFIPIGIVLLLAADGVREIRFKYGDDCTAQTCKYNFNVDEDFNGNVYFYYALENFFQNHRRYVKSRSDAQLASFNLDDVLDCVPYDRDEQGRPIVPCGAIANSMFNDKFTVFTSAGQKVPWTYEGVVWEVDKNVKFRNPPGQTDLCAAFSKYGRPQSWKQDLCQLDPDNPDNNGLQNVDFIVWMRTAALPSFKKLYRILDRNADPKYKNGLPKGVYVLNVENNYNVTSFNGVKYFVVSTTSWAGGNNRFLGISYIVIGSICVALGGVFTFIHLKFGHSFAQLADVTSTQH